MESNTFDFDALEKQAQNPATIQEKTSNADTDSDMFSPVSDSSTASATPGGDGDIFDIGMSFFEQSVNAEEIKRAGSNPSNEWSVNIKPGETAGEKKVAVQLPKIVTDISAEIYVEMFEGIQDGLGRMISGTTNDYNLAKKWKDRYVKISQIYFRHIGLEITPGQWFGMLTMYLLFNTGQKAWSDRNTRIKAENYRRKNVVTSRKGEQLDMFNKDEFVDNGIDTRTRFKFLQDGGRYYYEFDKYGQRAKKDEREQVPNDILPFLQDFFLKHGEYPKKKDVETHKKIRA